METERASTQITPIAQITQINPKPMSPISFAASPRDLNYGTCYCIGGQKPGVRGANERELSKRW